VDINKYIIDFLIENSSVIVPHLGRFNAVDKPSVVVGSVVLPPVRSIELNAEDDVDDGVLTAFIAKAENTSVSDVKNALEEFYNEITKKLIYKKPIILDNLGTLFLDKDGEIAFVPNTELNIVKPGTFGLKEINVQPVVTPTILEPVVPPPVIIPPVVEIPVTPPPVYVPPVAPVPPPVFTEPVSPPVFTAPVTPPVFETPKEQPTQTPDTSDSLFSDNVKVRENTDRRKTEVPPPVQQQSQPQPRIQPQQRKPVPPAKPKQKTQKSSSGSSAAWIIIIIIIIAAGAGGYFLYPKYFGKEKAPVVAQAPVEEPAQTPSDADTLEQSLDDSTQAQNALNPEPENTQVETKPTPKATPARKSTAAQGNIGNGKFIVVVGSFSTFNRAQNYGKQIASTGEPFEILDYGEGLVRVGVASFDNLAAAKDKVISLQSNRYCDEAWIFKGGRP
jgi:nucleoid DNA-binding protein